MKDSIGKKKGNPKTPKTSKNAALPAPLPDDQWNLRLYVAGQTAKSIAALANLNAFCKEHLKSAYKIEVIDLMKEPWHARTDQIVAIPTLVRSMPSPMRKIIGDLSNKEKVLVGFDLHRTVEETAETALKASQ